MSNHVNRVEIVDASPASRIPITRLESSNPGIVTNDEIALTTASPARVESDRGRRNDITDAALIQRVREGDRHAFRHLVERYESAVASTVIGMLGPGVEAEDVGQETFIRFFRSLDRFRGDAGVGTYVTRIAINLSLNALKRRKRRRLLSFGLRSPWGAHASEIDPDQTATSDPGPDGHLEAGERRQLMDDALGALSPDHRAVVVLRLIDGRTTKETAEILGLPIGTVLSRFARALAHLKNYLATSL